MLEGKGVRPSDLVVSVESRFSINKAFQVLDKFLLGTGYTYY